LAAVQEQARAAVDEEQAEAVKLKFCRVLGIEVSGSMDVHLGVLCAFPLPW
jgi:hypothetical protein